MIRKYAEIFCWKNVSSFCSAKATHIFSAKNIRILYIKSAKTVNEMTLNELVKLTMLWTTGPWPLALSSDSFTYIHRLTYLIFPLSIRSPSCTITVYRSLNVDVPELLVLFFKPSNHRISNFIACNWKKNMWTAWAMGHIVLCAKISAGNILNFSKITWFKFHANCLLNPFKHTCHKLWT